jgi:hypothetical protein
VKVYLCVCRSCGTRAVCPSLTDADLWAMSHWQPVLIGWAYLRGAVQRFVGVDLL